MSDKYLTINQLAEHLNVSPHTIHFWRREGTAPRAIKVGRQVRFDIDDVNRWLESHREGAGDQ